MLYAGADFLDEPSLIPYALGPGHVFLKWKNSRRPNEYDGGAFELT